MNLLFTFILYIILLIEILLKYHDYHCNKSYHITVFIKYTLQSNYGKQLLLSISYKSSRADRSKVSRSLEVPTSHPNQKVKKQIKEKRQIEVQKNPSTPESSQNRKTGKTSTPTSDVSFFSTLQTDLSAISAGKSFTSSIIDELYRIMGKLSQQYQKLDNFVKFITCNGIKSKVYYMYRY